MKPIAFTAHIGSHTSSGSANTLTWSTTKLASEYWNQTRFTAPKKGLYFFALSFMKNALFGDSDLTEDDVYLKLYQNGSFKGQARSGQDTGARGTGALSMTLYLEQNDTVEIRVDADGGAKRNITDAYFTGFALY